jgi:hypothetical protein
MKIVSLYSVTSSTFFFHRWFCVCQSSQIFSEQHGGFQRDKPLKIWGWADNAKSVTCSFNWSEIETLRRVPDGILDGYPLKCNAIRRTL